MDDMEQEVVSRIRRALDGSFGELSIQFLPETDSTNLRLKEWAREGCIAPPFLLVADSQTAGRGRLGRRFVSPAGTGLYMSLLVPAPKEADHGLITILAAVAVCRAIEETADLQPRIKWVNDLFVHGRKVCGILAEKIEQGIVIGIGVNLRTPPGGFPAEAGMAGALERNLDRAVLAGRIARHLLSGLPNLRDPALIAAYRARMPLLGAQIQYSQDGQTKKARVTGVVADGGLMVLTPDGPETLRCGEVTLGSEAVSRWMG